MLFLYDSPPQQSCMIDTIISDSQKQKPGDLFRYPPPQLSSKPGFQHTLSNPSVNMSLHHKSCEHTELSVSKT